MYSRDKMRFQQIPLKTFKQKKELKQQTSSLLFV